MEKPSLSSRFSKDGSDVSFEIETKVKLKLIFGIIKFFC
jgi:hypothetical protein